MFDVYMIYRSVTYGQSARAALDSGGVPCRLLRSPREYAPAGCAYAVTVRRRDYSRALRLVNAEGMKPEACYHRQTDGSSVRLTI